MLTKSPRVYTCRQCGSEYDLKGQASQCCCPQYIQTVSERLRVARIADRIDGYDRDDTGESNDY